MSTRNLLVFLTLLVVPFFCACEKEKTTTTIPQDPEMNHPDWNKLILTGQQRGITAIYGNYEDSLLVATQGNIYLTTNQGKDWRRVFSGSIGISGIMKHKDQLVALSSFSDIAGGPFLYSQDEGTTWTHQSKYLYWEEEPRLNRTQVDDQRMSLINWNLSRQVQIQLASFRSLIRFIVLRMEGKKKYIFQDRLVSIVL